MREIRALEVLERIGTPEAQKLERIGTREARNLVEMVANGADAVPTYEAQLILTRWAKIR